MFYYNENSLLDLLFKNKFKIGGCIEKDAKSKRIWEKNNEKLTVTCEGVSGGRCGDREKTFVSYKKVEINEII